MKKYFSIITPIYNAEKYLKRCLNSIINQTFKNFEVLLVIDGATDSSLNIVCGYEKIYSNFIKIIIQENKGVSSARNNGIINSNGKYLLFLDSDDYLENDTLEKLHGKLQNNDIDYMIFNNKKLLHGEVSETFKNDEECFYNNKEMLVKLPELIKSEKINSVWAKVYRNDIIKKNNIFFDDRVSIGEDLLFNIEYITKTKNMYISNESLYIYCIENNYSLTTKYIKNKYEQEMYVKDKIYEYLKLYNNKEIESAIKYIRLKNIYSCLMDLYHHNCKFNFQEKLDNVKFIKQNTGEIIILNFGIKFFILSCLYSFGNSYVLVKIGKYLYLIKNKRRNI